MNGQMHYYGETKTCLRTPLIIDYKIDKYNYYVQKF
jgi:hypothetical protein